MELNTSSTLLSKKNFSPLSKNALCAMSIAFEENLLKMHFCSGELKLNKLPGKLLSIYERGEIVHDVQENEEIKYR